MGKRRSRQLRTPRYRQRFHQIDMRDWLLWLHEARDLALADGVEHRRVLTIATEALTWHALRDRMVAAGLHELRDEPIFRAAKTIYLQVECETAYAR